MPTSPESGAAESSREHLRQIYDHYRTASLNRKYYACRLKKTKQWNAAIEILQAVANSSAVASFAIWNHPYGKTVWGSIMAVATLVAVVKPILQLGKSIERYGELYMSYTAVFYDLKDFVEEAAVSKSVSEETLKDFKAVHKKVKDLSIRDDISPSVKLLRRFQKEVNAEIPPGSLWMPGRP